MHLPPVLSRLAILLVLSLAGCAGAPPTAGPSSSAGTPPPPSAPASMRLPATAPPAVYAKSSIVVDGITGRILASKSAHERRAVASTQKLLTAIVVIEDGSLNKQVVIDRSDTTVEPTKLYLKVGERYSRGDLLRVLLVKSANDVAHALARDGAGSQEAFAARMNATARRLGMHNSNFRNPHGLTEPGQYSTASDIALLARAAYRYPFIRQSVRSRQITFVHNDGRTKTLKNTNKLLGKVDYVTGMKTGTTNASGRCLVVSGERGGQFTIAVVLGSNSANIWNDSEKLIRWSIETPGNRGSAMAGQ